MKTNGKLFLSETQFSTKQRKHAISPITLDGVPFNPDEWAEVVMKNRLLEWRESQGFTLREFSEAMAQKGFVFLYQYINKIETGEKSPSFDFLFALKKVFGLSPDDIFFQ